MGTLVSQLAPWCSPSQRLHIGLDLPKTLHSLLPSAQALSVGAQPLYHLLLKALGTQLKLLALSFIVQGVLQ